MALKHWGRDALRAEDFAVYAGNQEFAMMMQYHFLRTAGFEWIWECDGEVGPASAIPNHCDDGNMELSDITRWDAYGSPPATVTKDTTTVRSGSRSLKIVAAGTHTGVVSDALLSIGNPITFSGSAGDSLTGPDVNGTMVLYDDGSSFGYNHTNNRMVCSGFSNPANNGTFLVRDPVYQVPTSYLKFYNPSGVAQVNLTGATVRFDKRYTIAIWALIGSGLVDGYWKVEVDPGDGSWVELGQLALGDDWQLNMFSFYAVGTGSRYIRITDTYGGRTCYIDGVHVFRSSFEYAPDNVYDADPNNPTGVLTNPDRFSVSGGGYTPGKKDIGKWLFVWDENHNKNSGFYKIIADLGGGVVQVDMRSGSATFTTSGVGEYVNWRIVDVDAQGHNCWDKSCNYVYSFGYGLKSPHSSGWRFFQRISHYYDSSVTTWAAPDDEADFDFSSGQFYTNGPSTQRSMDLPYSFQVYAQRHHWLGEYSSGTAPTTRNTLMTDQDRSFVFFIHRGVLPFSQHHCHFIGYTGADPDHPGIEEFAMLTPWNTANYDDISFTTYGFGYYGVGFDPNGIAIPTIAGFIGWQSSNTYPFNISNAGPNAWSGKDWLIPLIIVRDPNGSYGCFSIREADVGLYMGRSANIPSSYMTLDSNAFQYLRYSLVMEWNGESIIA